MVFTDLNPNLSGEQIRLKEEVHRFAAEDMRPTAEKLDKFADASEVIDKGSPLWDLLRHTRELGYHMIGIPEEHGGLTLDPVQQCIIDEELGWGSVGLASCIGASSMPFAFAALFGSPELIDEYVVPFKDDMKAEYIGCWAITEPEHGGGDQMYIGSKQEGIPMIRHNTRARLDGDRWVINGQKSAWVANGTIATHAILHASLDGTDDKRDAAIFFMPLDSKGISKGKPLEKIGQRELNQGEIYFDDVTIPKHYMLIGPDMYDPVKGIMTAHMGGRESAVSTGLARAAFEEAVKYCKARVAGGRIIAQHQLVQKRLFCMFSKVEGCRAFARAVSAFNAQTMPPEPHYSMAALLQNNEAAFEVASEAVLLFGGNGLSKEYRIEKLFRDARAAVIAHGDPDTTSIGGAKIMMERY